MKGELFMDTASSWHPPLTHLNLVAVSLPLVASGFAIYFYYGAFRLVPAAIPYKYGVYVAVKLNRVTYLFSSQSRSLFRTHVMFFLGRPVQHHRSFQGT